MKDWHLLALIGLALWWITRKQGTRNAEVWEWVDYRGHKQVITVHREVH